MFLLYEKADPRKVFHRSALILFGHTACRQACLTGTLWEAAYFSISKDNCLPSDVTRISPHISVR